MTQVLKNTIRAACIGVAVMAFSGLASTAALAEGKPFTISVIYGPEKPQALIWKRFSEIVDRELPGEFAFNIVTDGALGGEKETTEGIRLGSIHGALSTVANLTTWVPEGALFDMPFMFRDQAHIDAVMAGDTGSQFKSLYADQGFKVFGFITYGARHVIAKEPIKTPGDVDGKKMRVLQSPLHIDLWNSLGANPTPVPITEAYNALQTGVVDYMDMTMSGYQALKLFEVVPYFSKTSHIYALGVMYMSKPYWDSLTDKQKQVFESAAAEAIPYFNGLAAAEQEASLAKAVENGATVVDVDGSVWQKAMEPFWESYAPKVGGMDKIKAVTAVQ